MKDIFPDLSERYESSQKDFNAKIGEVTKMIDDSDKFFNRLFIKAMKEQRAKILEQNKTTSEVTVAKIVIE